MSTNPTTSNATVEPANGLMLADLQRGDGQEHLRVTVVEHQGARYVSVRTWSRSLKGGPHRPTPRGVHVRASELLAVRDALDAAVALVAADRDGGGFSASD